MTQIQRIIKALSLALAFALAFGIIVSVLFWIGVIFMDNGILDESIVYDFDGARIADIDVGAASLKVIVGERLSVSTNIADLSVSERDGTLSIKQNRHKFFNRSGKAGDIIVTIPAECVFDKFCLDAGAGDVSIEKLSCDSAIINLGAGKTVISGACVSEYAKIDAGAGELDILGGELNNLKLDLGVGQCNISSAISGNSSVSCGIGQANIHIIGDPKSYTVTISTGIGQASFNGSTVLGNRVFGNGENEIHVDGGIGEIKLDIAE